jgi:hypothetical protein
MFEYRPTTSIETGNELDGIGVLLSTSMCLKDPVCLVGMLALVVPGV